jgi:hypothetical protein
MKPLERVNRTVVSIAQRCDGCSPTIPTDAVPLSIVGERGLDWQENCVQKSRCRAGAEPQLQE